MIKIQLIDTSSHHYIVENLGLEYIASFLRDYDVEVKLSNINRDNSIDENSAEIDEDCDIFGFAVFSSNLISVFDIANWIKKRYPNKKIFVGGRFATEAPVQILDDCESIDFVVLGDGEYPLLCIVEALKNNQPIDELPSIITRFTLSKKIPSIMNVNESKWPSRDLLLQCMKKNLYSARIISARGCCSNCSFCSHNNYTKITKTRQWVGREIVDVFNEIVSLNEKYNINSFIFNDGSFGDPGKLGKERIQKFCNLILSQDKKFTFYIYIRADTFTYRDIPLLKLMKTSGFTSVFIGLESAVEKELEIYNKKITVDMNKQSYKLFNNLGFHVTVGFIMLNPWSNKNSIRSNFNFLRELSICSSDMFIKKLEVYYKSDIFYRLKNEKLLIIDSDYKNMYNYKFIDPFINELDIAIVNLFQNATHFIKESDFNNFLIIFHELCHIYPSESKIFKDSIKSIQKRYSDEIKRYFSIIYIDNDIAKAVSKYDSFLEKIHEILKDFEKLKIRIITQKKLMPHFIKD